MSKLTKSQLVDENIALRHNLDLSATRIASLEAELSKLSAAPAAAARAKPAVYLFDPNVKGDFMRASKLAREFGGTVKRMVS